MRAEFYSESHFPHLNQAVADFVSRRIWGRAGCFEKFSTMGVYGSDDFLGGIVYHNYDPDAGVCEISGGSSTKKWLNADIVRAFVSMPFDLLGCQSVVARHPETRKDLRRVWASFGAVEYVIPRLRGRDKPAECVAVLTQEAWLESKFMQNQKVAA